MQGKCVGCSSSCAKCTADQQCLQCKASYLLYKGNCVTRCPDGAYPVQLQCYDCLQNCTTCTNGTKCSSCSLTHPLKFNDLCVIECPSNYEDKNGICEQKIDPINPVEPV